jgi:hypothetical protein
MRGREKGLGEVKREEGMRREMRRDEKERDEMKINEREGRLAGVYRRHDEDRFLRSLHISSSNVTYDIGQYAT